MLDLKIIPFSRFGSYFAINEINGEIYLKDMHCGDESPFNVFKMEFYKNEELIKPIINFTETCLSFYEEDNNNNYVSIVFGEEDSVNIIAEGLTLKLSGVKNRYDSFMYYGEKRWLYELYTKEIKYYFHEVCGDFSFDIPWDIVGNKYIDIYLKGEKSKTYLIIQDFKTKGPEKALLTFAEAKSKATNCFNSYKNKFICKNDKYLSSFDLAIYINWSSVVRPFGILSSYAMYMSKNWMNNIWSWDNCFNAMMLKDDFNDLALNQLELFIEHQDKFGQYPDFINDKYVSFNCVKPPIHAFALKKMITPSSNKERILNICESIKDSTYFWLNTRVLENKKYPHYCHGNDSGWDNASIFHKELPVISPDLTAYLIRQLDILSEIYLQFDCQDTSKKLKKDADKLFTDFLKYFYNETNEKFEAKVLRTGENIENNSLILYLPIVIGYRFEKSFLDNLVKNLLKNHLTDFGLATESLDSPFYKYNGYWQGPIWAPTTYLFIDALRENKYIDEAKEIAEKFCNLTLIGKMAENFDPITGEGLVDKSFTWTSSVFLLLQKEFY